MKQEQIDIPKARNRVGQLPPKPPDPDRQLLHLDDEVISEEVSMKPQIRKVPQTNFELDMRKNLAQVT